MIAFRTRIITNFDGFSVPTFFACSLAILGSFLTDLDMEIDCDIGSHCRHNCLVSSSALSVRNLCDHAIIGSHHFWPAQHSQIIIHEKNDKIIAPALLLAIQFNSILFHFLFVL